MKITKQQLRQIIKEELSILENESQPLSDLAKEQIEKFLNSEEQFFEVHKQKYIKMMQIILNYKVLEDKKLEIITLQSRNIVANLGYNLAYEYVDKFQSGKPSGNVHEMIRIANEHPKTKELVAELNKIKEFAYDVVEGNPSGDPMMAKLIKLAIDGGTEGFAQAIELKSQLMLENL